MVVFHLWRLVTWGLECFAYQIGTDDSLAMTQSVSTRKGWGGEGGGGVVQIENYPNRMKYNY